MRRMTTLLSLSGLLALNACALFAFAQTPENPEHKVNPPSKIEYDGEKLFYNPAWKENEIYIEANLDDDPEKEVLIGFVATYTPTTDNALGSDGGSAALSSYEQKNKLNEKETVEPIQNHAFYQIYKKGPGGSYDLIKTIAGMDQIGKVEILQLDDNKPVAIAVLSPGGEHYLDLSIYQWRDGGYRPIFNNAGSSGIEIDPKNKPVTVRIGKTDTFAWDSQSKSFKKK